MNTALDAALRVAGVGYTRHAITAGDRAQEQLASGGSWILDLPIIGCQFHSASLTPFQVLQGRL